MKTSSQNATLRELLERGQSITQPRATKLFFCGRLSARIKNLRDDGMAIVTEYITTTTGARIAKYSLKP